MKNTFMVEPDKDHKSKNTSMFNILCITFSVKNFVSSSTKKAIKVREKYKGLWEKVWR